MEHLVKYCCLGCGVALGIQMSDQLTHDDEMFLAILEKCPSCGRKLNKKSVRLLEAPRLGY